MGNSLTARGALAVAAGGLLGLAFPPFGLWWVMPVAIAGITLIIRGTPIGHGLLLGFLAGLTFFLVLLSWLQVIGYDAWMLVSALEAMFWLPLGAGLVVVHRLPWWPLWAAFLWVLSEGLRASLPFGGFPWGRLAFATVDTPLLPLAPLGGTPLVAFLVALAGSLLAAAVLGFAAKAAWRPGLATAGALALVLVPLTLPGPPAASGSVSAAVIQGGNTGAGLDAMARERAVLDMHVKATRQLADEVEAGIVERPQLVIWPENASDINPFANPDAYKQIDNAVRDLGIPVLVGALVDTADDTAIENSGIVWHPTAGPLERYVKRHPVPFGEYIPFRSVLTKLGIQRLDLIPRDFVSGHRPGLLDIGPVRAGGLICFEVAYDGLARDVVNGGAELLVVQTNNATYRGTGQLEQQFAISRFRAAEQQRSVLVAATSGITGIIARDGSVVAEAPEAVPNVLVADVPLTTTLSLASRLAQPLEWALSILGALVLVIGWLRTTSYDRRAGANVPVPLSSDPLVVPDPAETERGGLRR